MKKLRIYLDTSVINFLFAHDAPDFRKATIEFFEKHASKYEGYTPFVELQTFGKRAARGADRGGQSSGTLSSSVAFGFAAGGRR